MGQRLNYHKIIKDWMQYYSLPEDVAQEMFASVWMQIKKSDKMRKEKKAALRELYRESYNDVYRTVKSMIYDEDTVQEIMQGAYVKGFTDLSSQEDPENFLPRMKIIARDKAIDWFKGTEAFSSLQAKDERKKKTTEGAGTDE